MRWFWHFHTVTSHNMHADDIRIVLLQLKLSFSLFPSDELSTEWKSIMCVGIFSVSRNQHLHIKTTQFQRNSCELMLQPWGWFTWQDCREQLTGLRNKTRQEPFLHISGSTALWQRRASAWRTRHSHPRNLLKLHLSNEAVDPALNTVQGSNVKRKAKLS